MSKKFNSLSFGLSLILGVTVCVAIYWGLKPDESDSEQAGRTAMDVKEVAVNVPELSKSESDLANQIFAGRLLEIATEYKQYERVDQTMRWSPFDCSLYGLPRMPEGLGRISESDSQETHGRKLYFLYARKSRPYRFDLAMPGTEDKAAPLGQVLVKEAWHPIKFERSRDRALDPKTIQAGADGNFYYAGDKQGLFIMFKMTPIRRERIRAGSTERFPRMARRSPRLAELPVACGVT